MLRHAKDFVTNPVAMTNVDEMEMNSLIVYKNDTLIDSSIMFLYFMNSSLTGFVLSPLRLSPVSLFCLLPFIYLPPA
jgi:hypothetical protein